MMRRGAVPVETPALLVFRHLDPLVTLDVVVTGQEVEEVGPDPAQDCQPVLVTNCPGKQKLVGDLLHPLNHHLPLPLLARPHPPQVVKRHSTVESLQFNIITKYSSGLSLDLDQI